VRSVVEGADPERAFREAFGRTQAEVEAALEVYVQSSSFNYLRVPLASLPEPRVEVAAMAPAEVEYRLGDLLAHAVPEARDRAAARLEEAAELLAWIQATTRDPFSARRAADHLDLVSRAVRYNRFMELFGGLADQIAAGDHDAARATLEELRAVAKPGRQSEVVEALAAKLPDPPQPPAPPG